MKKHIKIFLAFLVIPILIFILSGLFQGIRQLTYHSDLTTSLESFRMEPPYCFIYFTPPNGNEEIVKIIGTCQLNDDCELVFAENDVGDITVNICKCKDIKNEKYYKTLMLCGFLSEKETLDIKFDKYELSAELVKEKSEDNSHDVTYIGYSDLFIKIVNHI